ncbi:hypothetical protein CPB86DRAFT_398066 [Serendipita vermifera]|nr:hypothetical protein CPB86DRAFT_398066 [Serendipita vermifera]
MSPRDNKLDRLLSPLTPISRWEHGEPLTRVSFQIPPTWNPPSLLPSSSSPPFQLPGWCTHASYVHARPVSQATCSGPTYSSSSNQNPTLPSLVNALEKRIERGSVSQHMEPNPTLPLNVSSAICPTDNFPFLAKHRIPPSMASSTSSLPYITSYKLNFSFRLSIKVRFRPLLPCTISKRRYVAPLFFTKQARRRRETWSLPGE